MLVDKQAQHLNVALECSGVRNESSGSSQRSSSLREGGQAGSLRSKKG